MVQLLLRQSWPPKMIQRVLVGGEEDPQNSLF